MQLRQRRRRRRTGISRSSRLRSPWIGAALAASLLLAVGGNWSIYLKADAMTATGERRAVTLPDGSVALLDTGSAIAFDHSGRAVRLLSGQAAFTVTADPAHPFTVEANGGTATALGTRFLVRREGDAVRVTVTEHRVRVASAAPGPVAIVGEGQSIGYGPAGLGRPETIDAENAAAWMDGVLVFKDVPLATVLAEIGRYDRGYVGAVGKARDLRVSGVFRIDDPVAAIDQLQRSLGLRSLRLTDRLILILA